MKNSIRIIASALVLVTLFCCLSITVLADSGSNTYMGASGFWAWVLGSGSHGFLDDVVGFVSSDYCPDSPNHRHAAKDFERTSRWYEDIVSFGQADYLCKCLYCGAEYYCNSLDVAANFSGAYNDYASSLDNGGISFVGRRYTSFTVTQLGDTS